MFTSIDKALVAMIMAALYLMSEFAGINFGMTEATVQGVVAVLSPMLVWLVPNRA